MMKPIDWYSYISKTLEYVYPENVSKKKNYPKVQLDEQVLISITAKLTCKLGKQMSYEKVSKTFQHALHSGAYQQFHYLLIDYISTNFFTKGSAKISILKSGSYITGRSKNIRLIRPLYAHLRVKDIINCLVAVFCRFPNLNYLQSSENNQVVLKNCIERAMEMANCSKLAFEKIEMRIFGDLSKSLRYEVLPFFANSLTELRIRDTSSFDLYSAELLTKSTKELNLRVVKMLISGFSVPRNNWLAQAFGHMDKLIYLDINSFNSSFSFIPTQENIDLVFKLKAFSLQIYGTRDIEVVKSFAQLSNAVPKTTKLFLVFELQANNSRNFNIQLINDIKLALRTTNDYPNITICIYIVIMDEIESAREENLKKTITDAFEIVKKDSEFAAIWLPKFTLTQAKVAKARCISVEFKCGPATCWLQFALRFNDLYFVADL